MGFDQIMKTVLITTPIRPEPTRFPPLGSLSLIKYLRKHGEEEIEFYDIDYRRPTFEVALEHILDVKPDIFAISAVVSTAYAYSKRIATAVKEALPNTLIILGGNMGASAEVLLRRTGVDLCVLGEGEIIFLNIVRRAKETLNPLDFTDIKGLAYIDADDKFVNSGYETPLKAEDMYDVDWDDLKANDSIDYYLPKLREVNHLATEGFNSDPRLQDPDRNEKRFVLLPTAKGCVAKCTFCHRWDKGIRTIPVDVVMERIDELVNKYDVGFIKTAEEHFGADRRWVYDFCEKIKPYDLMWVSGSRVTGITTEYLTMLQDAGCVKYAFGIESGSERILQVMEKKTSLEENYRAIELTFKRGMGAVIALVLGMPGESPETISETIKLCVHAKTLSADLNPNDLSINYAQALPGTSLYEFGRHRGLIGQSLKGEEEYLISISDRDAHDEYTTINFTDYPILITQSWRPLITIETNFAFVKKFGLQKYLTNLLTDMNFFPESGFDSGYFANPRRIVSGAGSTRSVILKPPSFWSLIKGGKWGLAQICYPVQAYRWRWFLPLLVLIKGLRNKGLKYVLALTVEYLSYQVARLFKKASVFEYKSLRKIVDKDLGPLQEDSPSMEPLRRGR